MKSSKELTTPSHPPQKKSAYIETDYKQKICIYVFEQRVYKTLALYVQKSFSNNCVLHNYSWFRKNWIKDIARCNFFSFLEVFIGLLCAFSYKKYWQIQIEIWALASNIYWVNILVWIGKIGHLLQMAGKKLFQFPARAQ